MSASKNRKVLSVFLIVAFLSTQVLFFIDEGFNDFRWMLRGWNWVFFFLYMGFMILGQIFVYKLPLKQFDKKSKVLISCVFGVPLGTLFLILLGYIMFHLF